MALREEFEKTGNWLFRWRSYLPLLLTGLIFIGMENFQYPGQSHLWDQIWEIVCLSISLFGLAVRAYTVGHTPRGTSGRNTRGQVAEVLNTTGIYSIVRHPLYLGNFFCWLGISMFIRIWWVSLIFILIYWLYYERIIFAEEEFLRGKFGEEYEKWAEKTPAFFPRFRNWVSPALAFSHRTILKREYSRFFAIIISFTFLEVIGDLVVNRGICVDSMWLGIFLTGLVTYLTLRTLKKKTKILDHKGR